MNPASTFVIPKPGDSEHDTLKKVARYLAAGLGLGGVDIYSTTASETGQWWCLHAITDCVITSVTYAPGTSSGSLAGATVLAGDRIYGQIIGLKLASGTIEAYRNV